MYLWVACQDITGKHVSISARMLREGLRSKLGICYCSGIYGKRASRGENLRSLLP
jgi:hypothetical protein